MSILLSHTRWCRAVILTLSAGLILTACGVRETDSFANGTSTSVAEVSADSSTPVIDILLELTAVTAAESGDFSYLPTADAMAATVVARATDDARGAEEIAATSAALDAGPVDRPFPTDAPLPPEMDTSGQRRTGLFNSVDECSQEPVRPDDTWSFVSDSCWRGEVGNQHFQIFAITDTSNVSANGGYSQGGLRMIIAQIPTSSDVQPEVPPEFTNAYWTPVAVGSIHITEVVGTIVTVVSDTGTVLSFDLVTRSWSIAVTPTSTPIPTNTPTTIPTNTPTPTSGSCQLYPISVSANLLTQTVPGAKLDNLFADGGAGGPGWLTWTGARTETVLVQSLTGSGDSHTYINPDQPTDHIVSIGDWVSGIPGVRNSKAVRDTLEALKGRIITIPVWDKTTGQGANLRYHVVGFALVELTDYNLPGQRISAIYQGSASCRP